MKVVKFGGSSLADDVRFQSVAEIIGEQAATQTTTAILSAPKGVTNRLVELCDVAQQGEQYQALLDQLQQHLLGICEQAGFGQSLDLNSNVDETIASIGTRLEGVRLLKHCPDHVRAFVICRGEVFSVNLMQQYLAVRGITSQILEPTKSIVSSDDYLNGVADIEKSRAALVEHMTDGQQVYLLPGFTAANSEGELTASNDVWI